MEDGTTKTPRGPQKTPFAYSSERRLKLPAPGGSLFWHYIRYPKVSPKAEGGTDKWHSISAAA
jgi:hypothetical protein